MHPAPDYLYSLTVPYTFRSGFIRVLYVLEVSLAIWHESQAAFRKVDINEVQVQHYWDHRHAFYAQGLHLLKVLAPRLMTRLLRQSHWFLRATIGRCFLFDSGSSIRCVSAAVFAIVSCIFSGCLANLLSLFLDLYVAFCSGRNAVYLFPFGVYFCEALWGDSSSLARGGLVRSYSHFFGLFSSISNTRFDIYCASWTGADLYLFEGEPVFSLRQFPTLLRPIEPGPYQL